MRFLFYLVALGISFVMIAGCAAPRLMSSKTSVEFDLGQKKLASDDRFAIHVEPLATGKSISDPYVVGEAKIGAFNVRDPIRSDEPLNIILTNLLRKAFSEAGFKLEEKEKAQYVLSGQVDRFWVEEYATGWSPEYAKASVRFDLIIKNREGKFVWVNTIEASHRSEVSIDATEHDIATLLTAAKKSIESIFKNESFWKSIVK
jgi:hypothetical protein